MAEMVTETNIGKVGPTPNGQYPAKDQKITRFIDHLKNGGSGRIEVVCIADDILRAVCVGKYKASKDTNAVHIGTIPTGGSIGHQVLYPMLASRTVRDKDGFIQINADGKIFVMDAKANTEYTFCVPLPIVY